MKNIKRKVIIKKRVRNMKPAKVGSVKGTKFYVKSNTVDNDRNKFPEKFPFWARLKISKNRTTLVIDEEQAKDKKNNLVPGFVHREAIHVRDNDPKKLKNYERIFPNPDVNDNDPMYLKRPSKLPQKLFKPHNKNLNMPQHLIDRYDKNNKKNKK